MEEQSPSKFNLKDRKTILAIVGFLVLLIAVPLGVYLVQQKQIFKPRAFEQVGGGVPPISGPETSFSLMGPSAPEVVGGSIRVLVKVRSDFEAANLFAAKLRFPADLLEVTRIETEGKGISNTFIKNWVETVFDNTAGTVSFVGGVPSPGYKTNQGSVPASLGLVVFRAKKAGQGQISFGPEAAIYRNTDNQNILSTKRELSFEVVPENTPTPSSKPTPSTYPDDTTITPIFTPTPTPEGIRGDINSDGKVTLADMSVLLSKWGKERELAGRANLNRDKDNVVNVVDYSMMIQILIENKIIKSAEEAPTAPR